MILELFTLFWGIVSLGMSAALTVHYPQYAGWDNVSRSIAWPITLYELLSGRM
jgi:hypothetical protein